MAEKQTAEQAGSSRRLGIGCAVGRHEDTTRTQARRRDVGSSPITQALGGFPGTVHEIGQDQAGSSKWQVPGQPSTRAHKHPTPGLSAVACCRAAETKCHRSKAGNLTRQTGPPLGPTHAGSRRGEGP
ncbi:hypothetical protein GGTG_00858 [Gaeumannomyces tritici R3-111a-1]|uniref:Uncharacterized protein n=1 Tax=Gaeumannomyces tritici (strain R3-111a-1) TaxID=644352 RepID=J3NHX2_GAET3|nr:hypothetical protein GGTG_00858 [Gaeumannomyces tritici R3-111a-1]EJT80865.1 hypothetical protein GGTG_00858 [Gaeumannomyces tritici R3-111a-1]